MQRPYPKRQEQDVSRGKRVQSRKEAVDSSLAGRKSPTSPALMGAIYFYQLS